MPLTGVRISAGDAHTLLLEGDLLDLGLAAQQVRTRLVDPDVATYNIDRNINYTNVCVYKCRFCAFYREPGDPEGYLLPFEEIGAKIAPRAKVRSRPLPWCPSAPVLIVPRLKHPLLQRQLRYKRTPGNWPDASTWAHR